MIAASTLAMLRGPEVKPPLMTVYETDSEGQRTATADAFVHVKGGTYNAMSKGRVIGQVYMPGDDHGALRGATGLPVHSAIDWSRMEGWAFTGVERIAAAFRVPTQQVADDLAAALDGPSPWFDLEADDAQA